MAKECKGGRKGTSHVLKISWTPFTVLDRVAVYLLVI